MSSTVTEKQLKYIQMTTYEEEYKQLNDAQKKAVNSIEGPMLVVAGPGTGKTQLLSMRVASILQQSDSDASNILCLTFTNKAAGEMRQRLQKLIGNPARNVVVRTFHSFAADIMNQYPDYFWQGARLSVAPDAVQIEIIQSLLAKLPLSNPLSSTFAGSFTALDSVKEALKLTKEAGITPDRLRVIIKQNLNYIDKIEPTMVDILSTTLSLKKLPDLKSKINKLPAQKLDTKDLLLPMDEVIKQSLEFAIKEDEPTGKTQQTGKWKRRWLQTVDGKKSMDTERRRNQWWLNLADIYEAYRDLLHQRGYYDYSDMLIEVLEQLQKSPDMLADIQEQYLYVMIDEFQDTNAAQLKLAHLVSDHYAANNKPNLMAVGDDDQSIFAFNGAELNNMLTFRRSYPDTELIVLSDNYRSSQFILDTASQIIDQAEDRLVKREKVIVKQLTAKNEPEGKSKIDHLSYPTRQHQQTAVAKRIEELWNGGQKDIAVLARNHESLRQLAAMLLSRKLPIIYDQQTNILEHEAVRLVYLIAKIATGIASGDQATVNSNLSLLVRHPMWHFSAAKLWQLATSNFSQPDWLKSLLDSDDQKLSDLGNWLTWLARISDEQPLPLVLEYIIGLRSGHYLDSPFKDYYLESESVSSQYIETLSALQILIAIVAEFSHRSSTLADLVRFMELNLNSKRVIADESWFMSGDQAVQLLTIYKAKGLEFEHVFVIDGIETMWQPKRNRLASPANLQLQSYGEKYDDYVRLLYVAASRAKRTLTATSFYTDTLGNQVLPTPLISELPLTIIKQPEEEMVPVLEEDLRWPNLETKEEKSLLKDRLDNYSLSSTALIDFLNLAEAGPTSFKERHLLRLPTARSAMGSYGTAIHAALETAQRLTNTSKLILDTVLDRFESALSDEHLAPLDYERYKTRGLELLEKLINNHDGLEFIKGGKAELKLTDISIGEAKINGKLDRLDIVDKTLIVSDYKTGKPLTSFDTKDKTKQVKAWRHKTQLQFYCLLTNGSPRYKKYTSSKARMIYVEADKLSQRVLEIAPSRQDIERQQLLIKAVWQKVIKLDFPDVSRYSQDIDGITQFENDLLNNRI